MSIKSLALAASFSLLMGGAALAAEACACCKDAQDCKMACCDKDKDAAPKDGAPSEHQH